MSNELKPNILVSSNLVQQLVLLSFKATVLPPPLCINGHMFTNIAPWQLYVKTKMVDTIANLIILLYGVAFKHLSNQIETHV